MPKDYGQACPVAKALELLGERWTLLVVRDLMLGKSKFHEFMDSLPGIAANILSDRLKRLEAYQIVTRHMYSDHPPRAEYHLTPAGRELEPVIASLAAWGKRFVDAEVSLIDTDCQHPIEVGFHCPQCDHRTPLSRVRVMPTAPDPTRDA